MAPPEHTHHVIIISEGLIPCADVYHTYDEAMQAWERMAENAGTDIHDGEGKPFDPDEDRFATDGLDWEARWEQGDVADSHDLLTVAVRRLLPPGTVVDVSEWSGCDEPDWGDPVYVTAEGDEDYEDAICDLDAAPLDEQARYIVEQLKHG